MVDVVAAAKCDACADVVAGGAPGACVPAPATHCTLATVREILAEAQSRVAAIMERYPKARVRRPEAGGLGVIMVLPDDPEVLDLPANPGARC